MGHMLLGIFEMGFIGPISLIRPIINPRNCLKCTFLKNNCSNIWQFRQKAVPLHRFPRERHYMVPIVQLVRASDCGSECRGFESH